MKSIFAFLKSDLFLIWIPIYGYFYYEHKSIFKWQDDKKDFKWSIYQTMISVFLISIVLIGILYLLLTWI